MMACVHEDNVRGDNKRGRLPGLSVCTTNSAWRLTLYFFFPEAFFALFFFAGAFFLATAFFFGAAFFGAGGGAGMATSIPTATS